MFSVNKKRTRCQAPKAALGEYCSTNRLFSPTAQLVRNFLFPQDFLSATLHCHFILMRVDRVYSKLAMGAKVIV